MTRLPVWTGSTLSSVHAYSFYNDSFVIVYAPKHTRWTPPGGGIEAGETYLEAAVREVYEESNMNVVHQELIGYQDIYLKNRVIRQARTMCIVEPYGEFMEDPDGDISEIRLINPDQYKQYFDWGTIGDHIMKRSIELNDRFRASQV